MFPEYFVRCEWSLKKSFIQLYVWFGNSSCAILSINVVCRMLSNDFEKSKAKTRTKGSVDSIARTM